MVEGKLTLSKSVYVAQSQNDYLTLDHAVWQL